MEKILELLHEAIPNASFSKHSSMDLVNFTPKEFTEFRTLIQEKYFVDIAELDFHGWNTLDDAIRDIKKMKEPNPYSYATEEEYEEAVSSYEDYADEKYEQYRDEKGD
jgi:hypothetical protein